MLLQKSIMFQSRVLIRIQDLQSLHSLQYQKLRLLPRSGDVVTVHEGTYREWVNPRNSGANKYSPIVYRAAEGEEVWIKGSEQITNWTKDGKGNVWKVVLPNTSMTNFHHIIQEFSAT